MINSKDKSFSKSEIRTPIKGGDEEYRSLPKYICYKAALLRERRMLEKLLMASLAVFVVYFIQSRIEISELHEQLRKKEYILAPGVQNFVTVNPQTIPDSYINQAVSDFVSSFGNISRNTIHEQFLGLKRYMSPELQIRFDREIHKWVQQTENEDLAQIVSLAEKQINTDEKGNYLVQAQVKARLFSSGEYLGSEDQIIRMQLRLVPPDASKRWFLEITEFSWSKATEINNQPLPKGL